MGVSVADLLGRYQPPERSVTVCLAGHLRDKHDELMRQIESARTGDGGTAKMGDSSKVPALVEQLKAVEAEMSAATVTFHFKALGHYALKALEDRFPVKGRASGLTWDVNEGAHALLAATASDPVMTEDEAKELLGRLDRDNALRLVNTAWEACTGSADIPFVARAFGSTSVTG